MGVRRLKAKICDMDLRKTAQDLLISRAARRRQGRVGAGTQILLKELDSGCWMTDKPVEWMLRCRRFRLLLVLLWSTKGL